MSCVLKETPEGVRVSLRAISHARPGGGREEGVDVGAIATEFGGGGHRFAAGFTSARPLHETLEAIREHIPLAS